MSEFEFSDFLKFAKNNNSDALAMSWEKDLNQLKRSATESFNDNNVVTDFMEKPESPTYHYCLPTSYVLKESTLSLVKQYLIKGNNPDAVGNFIPYLIQHNKVEAFVFEGIVMTLEQLKVIIKSKQSIRTIEQIKFV